MGLNACPRVVNGRSHWPSVSGDVSSWCRSCDTCQGAFPKSKAGKAPLGKTSLMGTPFHNFVINLVESITPISSQGNWYILTCVGYATRWPEAVPLHSIDTERVAEARLVLLSIGISKGNSKCQRFAHHVTAHVRNLLSQ